MDLLASLVAHPTARAMSANFAMIYGSLFGLALLLTKKPEAKGVSAFASVVCGYEPKRRTEDLWLQWAVCWVLCFGCIVGGGLYTWFGKWHYLGVCGGLAAPLLLQPFVWPAGTGEAAVPWRQRHCAKANVWVATFSFIGNWWYTHYFYTVLQASYSMPAHDVNGVPVAMFFATHFYFTLYHALAAKALRGVRTTFVADGWRAGFTAALVGAMAYTTAFTESATIAAYPCYRFADFHQATTLGSSFYGLYFVVSYPLFFSLDEPPEAAATAPAATAAAVASSAATADPAAAAPSGLLASPASRTRGAQARATVADAATVAAAAAGATSPGGVFVLHTLRGAVLEALGAGMLVLMLLDGVRVWLKLDLTVALERPCKRDASLTCAPFTGKFC